MNTKNFLLVTIILAVIIIAGCKSGADNKNTRDDQGIANPASEYCIQNGGELEIITDDTGQRGVCTLQDGTICDEWAYYRGECITNNVHICSDEEKNSGECTLEFSPVCGNDGQTYANGCGACVQGVDSWTQGECAQ